VAGEPGLKRWGNVERGTPRGGERYQPRFIVDATCLELTFAWVLIAPIFLVGLDRAQIPMVLVMTVTDLDAALAHVGLLMSVLACGAVATGAIVVIAVSRLAGVSRERAGAASTEAASSAAEIVLNMVHSSSKGISRSPAGWPGSSIMVTTSRGLRAEPAVKRHAGLRSSA